MSNKITNITELDEIRDKMKAIVEDYPEYCFLIVASPWDANDKNAELILGNGCLVCEVNSLVDHINLQHLTHGHSIINNEIKH